MTQKRPLLWLIVAVTLLACTTVVEAQSFISFSNAGPGFSRPIRDTYGCLLDETWRAGLLVGPDFYTDHMMLAATTSFRSSNGCGTGIFNVGPVLNTWSGTIYVSIAMWTGADTWDAARAGSIPNGTSLPIAVTVTNNEPVGPPSPPVRVYLTNLSASVGPLTTWMMRESVSGQWLGGYGQPIIVVRGDDVRFAVVMPPPGPWNYRTPADFRWQRLNSESNWVDIAGANTDVLHLASVGPSDVGEYRAVFNFGGCGCEDQIAQSGVTVIGMDSREGLTLSGPVGGKYRVDFSDVLGRTNRWQTLTNVVLSANSLSKIDPDFPRLSQRFYRVVYSWQ
jgi:hypothetical protein